MSSSVFKRGNTAPAPSRASLERCPDPLENLPHGLRWCRRFPDHRFLSPLRQGPHGAFRPRCRLVWTAHCGATGLPRTSESAAAR